jgi:peptidoglycan/LPS O-acetylase OafA/YrhL
MGRRKNCRLCGPVQAVCFWGPMRERPWKRPLVIILGLIAVAGGALLGVAATGPQDIGETFAVWTIVAFGIMAIGIGVFGCNACVAQAAGSA